MDIDVVDLQDEWWSVKVRHGDQQGRVFLLVDVGVHQLLIYFSSLLSSLRMWEGSHRERESERRDILAYFEIKMFYFQGGC